MSKSVLITGISGFVGRNLVYYFLKNTDYRIYGLDIEYPEIEGVEEIYEWNRLSGLKGFDVVIHLAGKAHDLKNTTEDSTYYTVNFGLTKTIYDWFLNSDTKAFLFFSSVKAVADSISNILTESKIPDPKTVYGKSKKMAEDYILGQGEVVRKKYYILRPAMIHGPGNKGNLNLLYRFVALGLPWPLAKFNNKRSFASIQNVCFLVKSLVESELKSDIFNICDDEPISTNELVKIISESLGRKTKFLNISQKFVKFIAAVGTFFRLPFNLERLEKLTASYIISNRKIINALNVNLPYSSYNGIKNTINYFVSKNKQ